MLKLLFVCTHNRCRSITAEAVARHAGAGVLDVRSAGSQPAGVVYPGTLVALQRHGMSTDNLISQSWDEFEDFAPDFVITVCDSAAAESCPVWMGAGSKVHWGLADPSKLPAGAEQDAAFDRLIGILESRIQRLCASLPACVDQVARKALLQSLVESA